MNHHKRIASELRVTAQHLQDTLDQNAQLWTAQDVERLCHAFARVRLVARDLESRADAPKIDAAYLARLNAPAR